MRIESRVLLPLLLALGACAHGPGVGSDQLPLRRVVVYRNGVGYFERAGAVSGRTLEFKVRSASVGDFLATLAVVELGGSSVRAASFPMHLGDAETPGASAERGKGKARTETVTLELGGGRHELAVGYVTEQPVWRPSYRLVLGKEGLGLQVWGIVQNVSGEDWRDVSLSLVAGAPIAFQATLGTPVIPRRPVVSDTGELIGAVPRSETTLAQAPRPAPPAPMAAPAPAMTMAPPGLMRGRASKKAELADGFAAELEERASAPAAEPEGPSMQEGPSMPRDLALLASTAVQGGTTRYDLPGRVTVPDDSATMVLLVAQQVPGEAVHLFAPDGGVPDSARHPFRVARFKNPTKGLLEKGPIAVFEAGAFLGQGVLEPLAAGGEATVPFALERGIAIDLDRKGETRDARLARIEAGRLTLERDQALLTTYRLRNGGDTAARVLVRHARTHGMRLVKPPEGTDDQVGRGTALVPIRVDATASAELRVEERRAFQVAADPLSPEADEAVKGYLADARADAKIAGPLAKAWELRKALVEALREQEKLQGEREILANAAEEAREGLRSISRSTKGVEELRQRLAARLGELETKLARIAKRLVELELQIAERRVGLQDGLQAIKLAEALPAS
jgi:hypothetical protein